MLAQSCLYLSFHLCLFLWSIFLCILACPHVDLDISALLQVKKKKKKWKLRYVSIKYYILWLYGYICFFFNKQAHFASLYFKVLEVFKRQFKRTNLKRKQIDKILKLGKKIRICGKFYRETYPYRNNRHICSSESQRPMKLWSLFRGQAEGAELIGRQSSGVIPSFLKQINSTVALCSLPPQLLFLHCLITHSQFPRRNTLSQPTILMAWVRLMLCLLHKPISLVTMWTNLGKRGGIQDFCLTDEDIGSLYPSSFPPDPNAGLELLHKCTMDGVQADVWGLDLDQTMSLEISASLKPHSLIPQLLFGTLVPRAPGTFRSSPLSGAFHTGDLIGLPFLKYPVLT